MNWQPGEEARFEACPRHRAALGRMDFWDAVFRAAVGAHLSTVYREETA